jgi:hypothetical protein
VIPKILHRIWVGGPMPEQYRIYGVKWERLNPGWTFRLWTDKDFADGWLKNQDLFDKAEQYVPADAVGQFRSDVARYEILGRFGGVYADCDVEPLKPLDDLLDVEAFAGWEQTGLYVGNTIIGGVPGAQFWLEMVEAVAAASRANKGRAATWLSGPRVVSRIREDSDAPLTIYPQGFFFPYSYKDLKSSPELKNYPDAYAVHHWGHQRELRGKPLQPGGTSDPRLSVAVMAHKSRERWVPDLVKALGADVHVVWDRFNDRHDTGVRALANFDPDATHHMVIQDDAIVAKDLVEGVKNALRYVPASNPVGLYVGRAKPRADEIRTLMARATDTKASFMVHKGPWWGVGIVVPTTSLRDLIDHYDSLSGVPNYDRRVSRYFESKGLYCYYTVPSLVDHRIEDNPSLVPGRGSQGRFAHQFIGPRSALDVDWSGPIVRGKA